MIRFTNVRGEVLVDDKKRGDRIMARDGLTIDPGGDYLIATTQASSTDVQADGSLTRLGPFSYLRVVRNSKREGRHNEYWSAKTTKLFLAKLWALAGGN